MKLRIALLQHPKTLDKGVVPPADIIVFPELVDGGYKALANKSMPHRPDDEYVRRFATASEKHKAVIVAGSMRVSNGRRGCTNTSFVFSRGKVALRYDKIHLFRPTGDHRYFTPGRSADTVRVAIGRGRVRIGVVICFDLRFPELMRSLAFRGMDLLVVPARWPARRSEAWETLLRARAIENQVFVAGCNAAGPEGGPSFVFGPTGARIPRMSSARGEYYTLDLDAIARARELYHALGEARWFRGTVPMHRRRKGRQE